MGEDAFDLFVNAAARIDQHHHGIRLRRTGPGIVDHGGIKLPARHEDAGRIHEHDLRLSSTMMARMRARVVCTLWLTIEILLPASWFTSVDLPAFGAPMMAAKPKRCGACGVWFNANAPAR